MLKLNQTAYLLRYWKQVEQVVIMKVQIKGIKIVDNFNMMYLCDNSHCNDWEYESKVYTSIEEAIENLKERVIE